MVYLRKRHGVGTASLESVVPRTPDSGKRVANAQSYPFALSGSPKAAVNDQLQLAQLLSSRICHDVIGPISVAAAIDDLRDTDHGFDEEGIAIVADSARIAAARLAFFRCAFGCGQRGEGEIRAAAVFSLLKNALTSTRLTIEWQSASSGHLKEEPPIPMALVRIVLCLALIATESLPRGGIISVFLSHVNDVLKLVIRAAGKGARVPAPALEAYRASSCAELTPNTAVGYYAGELARRLNAILDVDGESASSIGLELTIPHFGECNDPRPTHGQNTAQR